MCITGNLFSQNVTIAQNFSITDTDGNTYVLYDELDANKTVYLFFFSVDCGHCHIQAPNVDSVWQQLGSGTGEVLVWGFESSTLEPSTNQDVELFKEETGISFPCFSNIDNEPVYEYFEVTYYPQIHIICPDKRRAEISFFEMIESLGFCEPNYINQNQINSPFIVTHEYGKINITNSSSTSAFCVITDVTGKTLYSGDLNPGSLCLPVNHTDSNFYILRFYSNGETYCKKIFIQ